jgi:SHO1 osmosensor
MPPRASNERLDFTPILTHYLFLFTTVFAVVRILLSTTAHFTASYFLPSLLISLRGSLPSSHRSPPRQNVSTNTISFPYVLTPSILVGHDTVGTLWFAIWLQLFLIFGVIYTLASDSIAMYRFQIVAFGSVAIVFAVIGVNQSIFQNVSSLDAIAAGWLILAIVDILWVLYFTSEEDSLSLYLFNSLGTGGLSPPSRRRRTRTTSVHNPGSYGGGGGYTATGIGPGTYDTKLNNSFAPDIGSSPLNNMNAQPAQSQRSANSVGPTSPGQTPAALGPEANGPQGVNSPLMSTPGNAGIGAGGGLPLPTDTSMASDTKYPYKAKALYACACQFSLAVTFLC